MRGKESESESENRNSIPFQFRISKPQPISINPRPKNVFDSPAFINPEFTHRRQWHLLTTTIYSLSSSSSATSDTAWIYADVDGGAGNKPELLHPLTLKPHHFTTPVNPHLSKSIVTSFKHTDFPFDKLVFPPPRAVSVDCNFMVVLFGGGQFVARLPLTSTNNRVKWVSFSDDQIDDTVINKCSAYVVDRSGKLYEILHVKDARFLEMFPYHILPVTLGLGHIRFRKRLVSDSEDLYLVARLDVKVFRVLKKCRDDFDSILNYWDEIKGFDGGKVLFVSKDCCFFTKGFGGREYQNCIVFSETGFPKYGGDGWEYNGEDENEIRVYRMSDGRYGKVGESVDFPEIDWSPPSWVFDDREPDENDRLRKQEERLNSDIRHLESENMQCVSNSREQEDEQMQSNANIEGDVSLQEDVPASLFVSISAVEEEVTKTLLLMNGVNEPTDKETSREDNTPSAPRACTSSSSNKRHKSDHATTKFEGFDIRSDLVPTLQKIWRNHGNIIENCPMRSSGIIANALESLATVVQILEKDTVESLSECQADYLSSTLSDLKIMGFNVEWLNSFVEKAMKLHKSKALVDSLNKLGHLSSQVKEHRVIYVDKLAKLTEEENKLEKEMARVSKLIPFFGEAKLDEPFGSGLT